jgi:hypothetical protein
MSRESLFKDGSGGGEGCVSGPLLDGLAWLQAVLAMLADHLDSRCFRDTWRAIAATLNRCVCWRVCVWVGGWVWVWCGVMGLGVERGGLVGGKCTH